MALVRDVMDGLSFLLIAGGTLECYATTTTTTTATATTTRNTVKITIPLILT
jgi:hypothetical protein